jgi:hypothetical protein
MIAFARHFDMTHEPLMSDRFSSAFFALLAGALLLLTLLWHVPMMLWDHLDLVPIYAAWSDGRLHLPALFAIHGGHLHALAYAVLLGTTSLSHGRPWLDCLASWMLLIVYAGVVFSFARETFGRGRPALTMLVVLLALYPGHLANLQWGWQVAVFLCLAGAAIAIRSMTLPKLSWVHVAVSIVAANVALLSFAKAGALIPMMLALIALRRDVSARQRIAFAAPWLALGVLFALRIDATATSSAGLAHLGAVPRYALNFIGAGIARFATDLAPWLALAGLLSAIWTWLAVRDRRESLPWLGLCLFAVFASVLVAIGRAPAFGNAQAFVTRYVSFSSLFWLGWTGLFGIRLADDDARTARAAISLVAVLAVANALHMIKKAHETGVRARTIAETIRRSYPNVDRALLDAIYFNKPDVARSRLDALHALGFAPFDAERVQPAD